MKRVIGIVAVVFVSALTLMSCSKEDGTLAEGKGRVNVHLTDAPFPIGMVSSTEVTIDKVEIRQYAATDVEGQEGNFLLLAEGEMTFDLLELTNGITEKIATADLSAGRYDQIRLHVTSAKITLTNGSVFDLKIPSGSASGLKINIEPTIELSEGETADVLLDFDLTKSFVATGQVGNTIKGFIFKPVIRGVVMGAAGRIEGKVTDAADAPVEHAMIKLFAWENGSVVWDVEKMVISSYTDLNGKFKLIGLPVGTYSIICEMEGFKNDTVQNIAVTANHSTTANVKLETATE